MKKIIFVPTWRCNLKCSYCDYSVERIEDNRYDKPYDLKAFDKVHRIAGECTWDCWAEALEKFEPFHLEITGGEPTIYPDFDKLIRYMAAKNTWSITSNTLNTGMIEKLSSYNCIGWAASYHFGNDKQFIDNLFILKGNGFSPVITIVVTPENHKEAYKKIKYFKGRGFQVSVHPLLKQGFVWDEQAEILEKIKEIDEKLIFIDCIAEGWKPKRFDKCMAGTEYFMLMPDTKVLRCYSQILTDDNLGYLCEFEPNGGMQPCNMDCIFPCDRQIMKEGGIENE